MAGGVLPSPGETAEDGEGVADALLGHVTGERGSKEVRIHRQLSGDEFLAQDVGTQCAEARGLGIEPGEQTGDGGPFLAVHTFRLGHGLDDRTKIGWHIRTAPENGEGSALRQ